MVDAAKPLAGARRRALPWRRAALGLAGLVALLGAADYLVGRQQQGLLQARQALRDRLDRLAFHAVRTGIDAIRYDPPEGYRVLLRVQNAFDDPLYVMMPAVTSFVQVGPGWLDVPVLQPPAAADEGSVVRLAQEDRVVERLLQIEVPDYTELLPGYMHLKLSLDIFVSPEENPREEIGERHEDLFLYLRDAARAESSAPPAMRPDFIPLRAWTLVPRDSHTGAQRK